VDMFLITSVNVRVNSACRRTDMISKWTFLFIFLFLLNWNFRPRAVIWKYTEGVLHEFECYRL